MTSEVRVFQRKSSVDQSQTWTVTFRNGARESMSVGSNGMTGGLWTIDAVENDDDPNDVTRWVEVFHHSPQQPAPVAEKYVPVWGPEWEYVDREGRVLQFKRRLKFSVTPAIALTSTDEGDWNYNEDGSFWGARSPYHRDIVSQRPRTPAPVEPPAPSQPADVPEVLIGDLTGFDSGDLPPPYSVRMFVDLKGEQRFCLSKVVALVLPWTTTDEELARVKASIIARHAAPVFKELALKRDEYIDVLRKQVDASAAELTTLRERLAGAEGRIAAVREIVEQVKLSALKQADYEYAATMLNLRDCLDHGNAIDLDRLATLLPSAGRFVSIRAREKQIDELHERVKFFDEELNDTTALRADLARAKDALINIGSFFGCSAHLPWFSDDACDEVSAMIDEKGGEKRYDPAFYETYCAQVIADIVTGALSASASGEEADNAELR